MPRATTAHVADECANLIEDFRNGRGAAKNNLRRKLETITEKVAEEIHAVADAREHGEVLEIDVERRNYIESVKVRAADYAQYFGTFAGLFSGDDYVHPSSSDLAIKCMDVLYAHMLTRDLCQSHGDELVYRSWLGILTTS